VEGTISEPEYFGLFNSPTATVRVKCLKTKHSAPLKVLEQMLKHLSKEKLKSGDEAWVVVDRDQWKKQRFKENSGLEEKKSQAWFCFE